MSNLKGCFSHESDNWRTPSALYNAFMDLGFIDCFPFKSEEDEFLKIYRGGHRLFINPPFSKMGEVSKWVIKQAKLLNDIYLLIPARTDTKYFRQLVNELGNRMHIIFITGRLKYNDAGSAPFPTMLIIIEQEEKEFKNFSVMSQDELIQNLYIRSLTWQGKRKKSEVQ